MMRAIFSPVFDIIHLKNFHLEIDDFFDILQVTFITFISTKPQRIRSKEATTNVN